MIELISAAKVGKISETNVSLPEKVVSNQENVRNLSRGRDEKMSGTCPVAEMNEKEVKQSRFTSFIIICAGAPSACSCRHQ